ncbi:hypothetical protein BX600DRAFT_449706 [Xylariales sp. PMI_506]|nr:hypothetical protein BX600DRAFT_449706 [Xylariales sp. PMI_506]
MYSSLTHASHSTYLYVPILLFSYFWDEMAGLPLGCRSLLFVFFFYAEKGVLVFGCRAVMVHTPFCNLPTLKFSRDWVDIFGHYAVV